MKKKTVNKRKNKPEKQFVPKNKKKNSDDKTHRGTLISTEATAHFNLAATHLPLKATIYNKVL